MTVVYCLDHTGIEMEAALALWAWLLPPGCRLLAVSKLGDLFLTGPETNRVLWLDLIEGQVTVAAESPEEYRARALDPQFADVWFLPGFIEAAEAQGKSLRPGECFAFEIHPKFGGALSWENLKPMNLIAYHAVCAVLHELPPGTRVSGFSVSGPDQPEPSS